MQNKHIPKNYESQIHLLFDKNKADLFLKELNMDLYLLTYKDNIENLYHNFTTTLSTTLTKFYTKVSYKKNNIIVNPWYDNDYKDC